MIPINSIEIPVALQRLCGEWHGGLDCMLYAVSSTGGLTMGTIRPVGCDTDEKWYLNIWREFASDLGYAAMQARKGDDEDADELEKWEVWVDGVCDKLEEEYGLEDWES
jgi:hypothetical protein